jgi:hypothetical protein
VRLRSAHIDESVEETVMGNEPDAPFSFTQSNA